MAAKKSIKKSTAKKPASNGDLARERAKKRNRGLVAETYVVSDGSGSTQRRTTGIRKIAPTARVTGDTTRAGDVQATNIGGKVVMSRSSRTFLSKDLKLSSGSSKPARFKGTLKGKAKRK